MLNAKQKKCVELMVLGNLTQKEIAKQIKITEQTICNWKKDVEFMGEFKQLLNLSIQSIVAKAFYTHTQLLKSKVDMVKYLTAKDILDRAGYKPDERLKLDGVLPVFFTGEAELKD